MVFIFQQQHVVPQRGQGKQNSLVCLPKLWLQARGRFQLHLCQQNYARNWVSKAVTTLKWNDIYVSIVSYKSELTKRIKSQKALKFCQNKQAAVVHWSRWWLHVVFNENVLFICILSVNWPTLCPMLFRIQHCHVRKIMPAQSVAIAKRYFSKHKPDAPKKRWDCITCAPTQTVRIDGLNSVFLFI